MTRSAERQREFAAALLDPARPTPPGVVGPDGDPSHKRFAVYRNNCSPSAPMAQIWDCDLRRVLVSSS